MGLSIAQVMSNTATFTWDFILERDYATGRETFEPVVITYRPAAATPKFDEQIAKVARGEVSETAATAWAAHYLSKLVISWDVEGEGGGTYPLDEESLKELPHRFLIPCVRAIIGDMGKVQAD